MIHHMSDQHQMEYPSAAINVRRHCASCNMDIRSGDYEGHECVPSHTPEDEKQAAELLKRTIFTALTKVLYNLLLEEQLRKCFDW